MASTFRFELQNVDTGLWEENCTIDQNPSWSYKRYRAEAVKVYREQSLPMGFCGKRLLEIKPDGNRKSIMQRLGKDFCE